MTRDPYRYFRIEAQELLESLGQGLLDLEARVDPQHLRGLLRHAHTLKGASRVVKVPEIADLAHELEELLVAHRDTTEAVPRDRVDLGLRLVDRMRDLLARLQAPSTTPAGPAAGRDSPGEPSPPTHGPERDDAAHASPEAFHGIRVPIAELDVLLRSTIEAEVAVKSLPREVDELGRLAAALVASASAPSDRTSDGPRPSGRDDASRIGRDLDRARRQFSDRAERLARGLAEVRAIGFDLRLIPADTLLGDVVRAARDAATTLDKQVEVHCSGGETSLDAHVLLGVRSALVHIVRNSVAHGIEAPAERLAVGKPAPGRVEIAVERRGHTIEITCRDDGRGLDLESLRAVASERGLVASEAASDLTEPRVIALLLHGGMTTTPTPTGVSGRGVGLDAARQVVEGLGGTIRIRSVPGQGVTVGVQVPISLAALPALAIDVDGEPAFVPLHAVRRTVRVPRATISHHASGDTLALEGKPIPFVRLAHALGRRGGERRDMQSAVLVAVGDGLTAVGVDRLAGVREVLVRPLPEAASVDPIVSGATLDEDGIPRLVLSPAGLMRAAVGSSEAEDAGSSAPPPLLVVDDSLTTRMLEQTILESAGYQVDLAVSGEDGLEKARGRDYGVFIVDVEMPGMSGFEFVTRVRGDPALRHIPTILVTSRNDPADLERGKEVGAQAYIVKSDFDQARLLAVIRRCLS